MLLIGQQGLGHFFFSGTGPCFLLAERFRRRYANGRENVLIRRHSLSVRHLQQANQLLLWINYIPLVLIRGPHKNAKTIRNPYLGLDISIHFKNGQINMVTQLFKYGTA
jgi:hypothetical protein